VPSIELELPNMLVNSTVGLPASTPIATIKAYRRTGGAVVTVERTGFPPHRYCVSLKRYRALQKWAAFGKHPWKMSGAWMRSSLTVSPWATQRSARNDSPTNGQGRTGGDRTPAP
jgi:hypothetical protein